MAMVVQHNITAMNSNRNLGITSKAISSSTEKLSSGYKINRAADNAAGLAISEKMRKQVRGLTQASTNAEDGISAVQTAEGALSEVQDMLQRMSELATQASNGTNSVSDREYIQDEVNQILTEIDRVAETTKFNETYLLKGGHDTQTNILKGHDAGIKGTFVDSTETATLTADLSVGNTINIAGQNFNICEYDDAENSKDSMTKLQNDIKKIANVGAKVTIDGTEYVMELNADSGKNVFSAGTGDTYSAEELSGRVKNGSTVYISNAKDADDNDIDAAEKVIARDYTSPANITADEAAKRIQHALKQANDVGATKDRSEVNYVNPGAPTTAEEVATFANNPDATAEATAKLAIYDTTDGKVIEVASGEDITEYAKDSTRYLLYKEVKDNTSGTGPIAQTDTDVKTVIASNITSADVLVVHNDGVVKGANQIASGTTVDANTIGLTTNGLEKGFALYKAVSLEEVADLDGVTYKAQAELDNSTIGTSISFEDIDTTDAEKAKEMVDGQNALLDAIANNEINFTVTVAGAAGTSAAQGVFSHEFTDDKLDISEAGVVTYNGTQIATMSLEKLATGVTPAAAGAKVALAIKSGTDKDANFEKVEVEVPNPTGGSEYTFTIDKGTTQVAKDLAINLHVGADADMNNKINLTIAAMDAESLGVANLNVTDGSGIAATYAIDAISDALAKLSAQRSQLGAVQNRLDHTINNLDNIVENTASAESTIRDTDMADEMVNYSKYNILMQAGQSMLAQANQSNQGVLSLLG